MSRFAIRCNSRGFAVVVTLLGVMLLGQSAVARGAIVDLGTLGIPSQAFGINNRAQVVGTSAIPEGPMHAVLWDRDHIIDLGALAGGLAYALDINDRGQAVGFGFDASYQEQAVLWQNGQTIVLIPFAGAYNCRAQAINASGVIVGMCWVGPGETAGFLWSEGVMQSLPSLGCPLRDAVDINGRREIVGYASGGAAVCNGTNLVYLGTLGGSWSQPNAINDRGQVVGRSETADGWPHAFLWTAGEMRDLGTLGGGWSEAFDINNRGQVVGYSGTGTPEAPMPEHAFLWDGLLADLGVAGEGPWFMSRATAINERGDIAGFGDVVSGWWHALLWPAQGQ